MLGKQPNQHPWPDFIIGGAPRSGTTFLCHALDRHPEVFMAKPFIPEPKAFVGKPKQREDYLSIYQGFFPSANEGQLRGEKSSAYFESAQCCELIKSMVPSVKFVFIVREPVSRAYSNWIRSTENGLETLSFEEAVKLEGKRPNPLPPEKSYARPFDYLTRGHYATFAERYYQAFGREAVQFLLYEDLGRDPGKLLRQLHSFLGIAERPQDGESLGLINSARENGALIRQETERELRGYFAAEVSRFTSLTGFDVSAWGY